MKRNIFVFTFIALALVLGMHLAWAAEPLRFPENPSFTTLVTTPLAIEGLTGDNAGNLYTSLRNAGAGIPCPVWKINLAGGPPVVVGYLPTPSATTPSARPCWARPRLS